MKKHKDTMTPRGNSTSDRLLCFPLFRTHKRIPIISRRNKVLFDRADAYPTQQVKNRTSLVICAARARSSERLLPHDRACRFVIDIEIACRESQSAMSVRNCFPIRRKNPTG